MSSEMRMGMPRSDAASLRESVSVTEEQRARIAKLQELNDPRVEEGVLQPLQVARLNQNLDQESRTSVIVDANVVLSGLMRGNDLLARKIQAIGLLKKGDADFDPASIRE